MRVAWLESRAARILLTYFHSWSRGQSSIFLLVFCQRDVLRAWLTLAGRVIFTSPTAAWPRFARNLSLTGSSTAYQWWYSFQVVWKATQEVSIPILVVRTFYPMQMQTVIFWNTELACFLTEKQQIKFSPIQVIINAF